MKYTPPSSIMIIALASSLSISTTRRGAVAGAVASAAGRRISLDAAPVVPAFALGGGGRHPHRRCGQLDRASPRDRPSSSSSSSFAITSSSGGFGVSSSHVRASSPSIGTSRRIASDVGDDYAATDRLVDIDIVGAEEVEAVDWGEIDDEEEEEGGDDETSTEMLLTDLSIARGRWQNPRSRWARRRHRLRMKKLQGSVDDGGGSVDGGGGGGGGRGGSSSSSLDWETFEFGTSPKMDRRFDEVDDNLSPSNVTGIPDIVLDNIPSDSVTYQSYVKWEADVDEAASVKSIRSKSDLMSLSPDVVGRSIHILSPYVQSRRLDRIDEVLGSRTRHARFLFENPSNPSNVYACLRTLDSFGVQYVDVVVRSDAYAGKAAVNQKRGARTAMGSASWMTVRQFGSAEEAIRRLRTEEGCLVYASDLNPNAKDVRDLTWDVDFDDDDYDVGEDDGGGTATTAAGGARGRRQRPICIVMGNEERGISDEMRALADETFYLPMSGFAESFNLSVATAITLAYMKAASGRSGGVAGGCGDGEVDGGTGIGGGGPLRPGDLDPHELQCLKLRGVLNSLAQKRLGKILLDREGIILPKSMYND